MRFVEPDIFFSRQLPSSVRLPPEQSLMIYDRILEKNPQVRAWIQKFPQRYPVSSGEELKDLSRFPEHMQKILTLAAGINKRPLQVVAVGGGTVGDFAGFVASVLKRGVSLVQVPSTWLAAVDSAHGGKNALNVSGIKNQVGTFHFPVKVFISQDLLFSQPPERLREVHGEVFKMALLQGGALWRKFSQVKRWNSQTLWKLLPELIEGKYKIVRRDPFETKGLRQNLNLGHTLGHVFEAELAQPHGLAVESGIQFSLEWSRHLKILKSSATLPGTDARSALRRLRHPARYLAQDKKSAGDQFLHFIFVERPGKVHRRKVHLSDILAEIQRQSQ